MSQDFLRKELKAINVPLSQETLSCLYGMKPAVARNILRNGIATKWDSERVRVGAGEALPSLGTTATMDSNSSKALTPFGEDITSSAAGSASLSNQLCSHSKRERVEGISKRAQDIDRLLFLHKDTPQRFEIEREHLRRSIESRYRRDFNQFYKRLDHIDYELAKEAEERRREAALNANSDVKVGDYSSRIDEAEPSEEIKSTHEKMPIESVADKVEKEVEHDSHSRSIMRSHYTSKKGSVKYGAGLESNDESSFRTCDEAKSSHFSTAKEEQSDDREIAVGAREKSKKPKKIQKEKTSALEKTIKPRGDLSIPPSKYRSVGWKKEMGSLMGSRKPISYIEEFRNPESAQKYDYSNLISVNGYTKNLEKYDLDNFEENKRHKIKEARHECNKQVRLQMRKEGRRKKLLKKVREFVPKSEFEEAEEQINADLESLSSHSSEADSMRSGESFRQLLDDVPLRDPDDRDYMFVANKILPRENIEEKLLRMQKTPTCASTVNDVSKTLSEEIESRRLGRRLLKQRINNLAGTDDVRARFSVETPPDVDHVISFTKPQKQGHLVELAKAELKRGSAKDSSESEKKARVDLGPELTRRINAKLQAVGLPTWEELRYREPEDISSLFMTTEARPMKKMVEYRKIDLIGLLHKPFLVDYQKDKVTGETIARPRYSIETQTNPKGVFELFERLTANGVFCSEGQKYVSAGEDLQRQVSHQQSNDSFLDNVFGDYLRSAGSIGQRQKDYFEQFYDVIENDSWEDMDPMQGADVSAPSDVKSRAETKESSKILTAAASSRELAEQEDDFFSAIGADAVNEIREALEKGRKEAQNPSGGDNKRFSEDTWITFGSN